MKLQPEQDVEVKVGGTAICLNALWNDEREKSWVMPKEPENVRGKIMEQARGDGIQRTGESQP